MQSTALLSVQLPRSREDRLPSDVVCIDVSAEVPAEIAPDVFGGGGDQRQRLTLAIGHGAVHPIVAPNQRTAINTEVKSLLLSHAFERLGCVRVEFKTDGRNLRSQRALERIGATREGVLRNHMIVQNDFARDSVYFSVIDREWTDVKDRLQTLSKR